MAIVSILAYGQTGAGKSFTMEGSHPAEAHGIIPRSVNTIVETIKPAEAHGVIPRSVNTIVETIKLKTTLEFCFKFYKYSTGLLQCQYE